MPLWLAAVLLAAAGRLSAQQRGSTENRTDSEGMKNAFAVVHAGRGERYRMAFC